MPKPAAILFDFDGVLADTEPIHFDCWRQIIEPFGIHLTWEYYSSQCIGISDRLMLEALARSASRPTRADDLWDLYPVKKEMFRLRVAAENPIPQANRDLLRSLEGIPAGVVTSSGFAEIQPMLLSAGILDSLAIAVYGDQVKRLKPDPEPYRTALERLGVTSAVVLEDSAAGLQSAEAAGCEVIRVQHVADVPGLVQGRLSI